VSWRKDLAHGARVGGAFTAAIIAIALLMVGLLWLAHVLGAP
jgi:hypothetical protein